MQMDKYTIAVLIAKYMANNISRNELHELESWRKESAENEALFEKLIQSDNFNQLNTMAQSYDRNKSWQALKNQIDPQPTFRLKSWYYYAAAAVLLPFLLLIFFKEYKIHSPNSAQENLQVAAITPGSNKATLILDDGSQIELNDKETFLLEEKEGTKIKKDSTGLNYESNTDSQEIIYNQIKVPRGGEYTVVLSDGSRVYLNAMSSLRYPVNFQADSRTVELTGEAYFEVKKSETAFVVSTKDAKIEVLGTSFNVSTYPEDEIVRTTLVEGRVKIQLNEGGKEMVLNPSEQMAFNRVGKELSISKVDVNSYIAWKEGLFYFKDWQLKDIMSYLSRWYDFKVEYQNKNIQTLRFGGKFDRYGDLKSILNLFEQTGKISAKIEGNTIILKEK
jgi:ferric-dicitrate binding protein FerR (iron transport regulator)